MKKRKSFSIKLNKNKKNKNKNMVLLVIASIVAAVGTAVFGILKWKGDKNAHDESRETVKPTELQDSSTSKDSDMIEASSASNGADARKPQPPARFAHRKLQPGELDWEQLAKEKETEQIKRGEIPEYMLADVEKPQRGIRRKNWKIALSGTATLLAVAVVSSNIAQYLRPSEAMAKESFAGIGKIVAEHDEGNPYKILDIVPVKAQWSISELSGDANSGDDTGDSTGDDSDDNTLSDNTSNDDAAALTSFSFSTGTMGYLAGDKVPFSDDLGTALKANPVFSYTASRKELINKLIPESSKNAFPWIKYEEAYGGVHNVSEANGWILLFNNQVVTKEEDGTFDISKMDISRMSEGIFKGTAIKRNGGDRAGYDFICCDEEKNSSEKKPELSGSMYGYVFNPDDGVYYAMPLNEIAEGTPIFKPVVDKEIIVSDGERLDSYTDKEGLYIYVKIGNGGRFDYVKIIRDIGTNDDIKEDSNGIQSGEEDGIETIIPVEPETPEETPESVVPEPEAPGIEPEASETLDTSARTAEANVSIIQTDIVVAGKNTVLSSGWRRLAELGDGSILNDALVGDSQDDPTKNDPIPSVTDDELTPTTTPDGDKGEDDQSESGTTETGTSEDNSEFVTIYYELHFEPITVDELADYAMIDDEASEDEESYGISLFASSEGIENENKYIYVGSGQGDWKLTESSADDAELIGVYNAPVYYRCQAGNDWLRQYVFGSLAGGDNASSSFRIEVTTVRADEVTAEMVYEADLIYMESGQNMFLSPSLAVSYIQHIEGDLLLGDVNDMSEGVVNAILSRTADDLMPVIVDYAITEEVDTNKYAGTNYQLLAKALLKRNLAEFYNTMNDGTNLIANLRMNLGNGSDTDNSIDFPNKYSNNFNYSYVNQNVFFVKNELLVSDDFADFFDDFKANAGFGDVLAAIMTENTTLAEDDRIYPAVSKARAIQYIINFSVGIMGEFDDLTILELQPTANIDPDTGGISSDLYLYTEGESNENTKLYWKTESMKSGKQILYSKKPFSVTTDVKSVVEFNGEWEDINGTYDMIFIGLDGRNLNLGNDKPRRTIYNNNNLNGKVYHTGDDAGSGTYDSNDITSQKMMDLLEYLQAGYPIVVENDCFKDGTAREVSGDSINTKYIAEDTVMYRFLSVAVSDEMYSGSIFTVSDTMSSAMFMARMKTSKPRIEVLSEVGSGENQDSETSTTASTIQRLVLDENDEYHGRIAYQIRNNRGEEYLGSTGVRLYADMNYDGIFGAEEELTEGYTNEGNVIDVTIDGMGLGIIPWKLEVSDIGNEYRRDSVQGYFELLSAYEEEIRVLQVTTQKGNYSVDLEAMYNKKDDSMLANYLKGAEGNANLSFAFETVTPDTLNTRLGENDKYLNQWDIVVVTVDDGVSIDSTAFTNYINAGRSLLVCSQNKNSNNIGLTSEMLGWSAGRTFVSLGESNLHRYAGLDSVMYQPQHGNLKAEKINEGSILCYPYQLNGESFNFGNTEGGLRASEYLLDFEDNLRSNPTQAYVTVWLTLGGNHKTAYGISPRDARNNYYCYSKGNVVYLAQSEYHYTYDTNGVPEGQEGSDECKFFINALMAAYNAGVHSSDVSIVSGFAETSASMKSISVPFDQEWRDTADDGTQGILDNTVDVYFKFADSNIGANKTVTVSFYYEDPAGTKEFVVDDKIVMATQFGSDIWTVTDNKLVPVTANDSQNTDQVGLIPGKVYQIKAPVIPLRALSADVANETTNDAGIYVLVESKFTRTGKLYEIDGFGMVSLNRANLFLLE